MKVEIITRETIKGLRTVRLLGPISSPPVVEDERFIFSGVSLSTMDSDPRLTEDRSTVLKQK